VALKLSYILDEETMCEDNVKATVLNVEITEPNENPVTDNNFTFDSTADPNGECDVIATGTSGVASENSDLEWELTAITGATLSSEPDPAEGASITFTYTRLPSSNAQFGEKTLTLTHPDVTCDDEQTVEIFFTEEATNNPFVSGFPNWYEYWSQTDATAVGHMYWAACGNPYGRTLWDTDHWQAYISYDANEGQDNPLFDEEGIDFFAVVCRHEAEHVSHCTEWWPDNYDEGEDGDGDGIPDDEEAGLGYDPEELDTFIEDDWPNDCEHYCEANRASWGVGSADDEDWANPGHQSAQ